MNENAKTILLVLEQYLQKNPSIRFTQALFNLGINEFADKQKPEACNHLLRDVYNDSDEKVLNRMSQNEL